MRGHLKILMKDLRAEFEAIGAYLRAAPDTENGIFETVCWSTAVKRKAGNIIERAQCQNGKAVKRKTAETDGTTMLRRLLRRAPLRAAQAPGCLGGQAARLGGGE